MTNEWSIVCCNVMSIGIGDKRRVFVNDVVTNKRLILKHDIVSEDSLWTSVMKMSDSCAQREGYGPGTIMFIGKMTHSNDCIECDWCSGAPVMCMTGYSTFICYTEIRNGEVTLIDVITSKSVSFDNLDQNEGLKKSLSAFKQVTDKIDYMQNGVKRVFIGGVPCKYDKDEIVLSAKTVTQFGDSDVIHHMLLTKTLEIVTESLDKNGDV